VAYDSLLIKGESMNASIRLVAVLLLPSLAAAAPPAATPPEPGEQWEQTVEMQMTGFSMPPQTSKVCVPKKGISEPPGAGRDDQCKVTDVRNDGKKMSWSVICEKDQITGTGEIVQRADGYDGRMTMKTTQGDMVMKLSGKRLGGACDAAETKRKVDAIQAEGAAQLAQGCRDMAARGLLSAFTGPSAICKDPTDRAALCRQAATREGVSTLSAQPAAATQGLASVCGKDLAAMTAEACADAGRNEAERRCTDGSDKLLAFIGQSCPAQTQVVAQRECAGRTYTDLTSCYRSFCTSYAGNLLDKGKKAPAQPAKPDDAVQDAAKKAAKSLLPW
jgi:hypothetical protein